MITSINKKKLHLILIGVLISYHVAAQSQLKGSRLVDKLIYESTLGVQFGTITAIEISPLIGFKISEPFIIGIGFTYQYNKYRNFYMNIENGSLYDRKINIIGSRFFARYYFFNSFSESSLLNKIFLHTEYEHIAYKQNYKVDSNGKFVDVFGIPYSTGTETIIIPGLLVGAGINQNIGSRTYASILFLYNLNETNNTPYRNPVIRIGLGYGI